MKSIIRVLYSSVIITLLFAFSPNDLKATHTNGTEIFYRWVADSTYEVSITFYRNCYGFTAGAPMSFPLRSRSSALNQDFSTSLLRLPTSGIGVPPLEPPNLYNCILNTSGLCIEEYVYRGNWTSRGRARDWELSTTLCCRPGPNATVLTPANIAYNSNWVQCGLNNLDFPDNSSRNSSPFWHNRRPNHPGHTQDTIINYFLKTLCQGVYYTLDQDAIDYDGDSLSYNFYWPQGTNGFNVSYINSYSFSNPLPTMNGPLSINPVTGIISVIPGSPTATGVYAVGIEAKEWRGDTTIVNGNPQVIKRMIGYNRRELTIIILDSNNCRRDSIHPKTIYLDTLNIDKKLRVKFHNGNFNSQVRCNSISPDGSEFRIVDSSNYVAPFDSTLRYIGVLTASWTCNGGFTDEIELTLDAPLTCGNYSVLLKVGSDLDVLQSECGFWENQYSSAEIITEDNLPPVDLGRDTTVCKWRPFSIELDAGSGYAAYYWNTWDSTQKINVSYPKTYHVEVQNKFGCSSTDSMTINLKDCGLPPKPIQLNPSKNPNLNKDFGMTGVMNRDAVRMKVYPNPTSGVISISGIQNMEDVKLSILNLQGSKVEFISRKSDNNKIEIDLGNLPEGLYFIQLYNSDQLMKTERIVLRRN